MATQANSPRARPAGEIASAAQACAIPCVRQVPSPPAALQSVLAESGPEEIICITGSFYVAGEIRAQWGHPHSGGMTKSL